MNKWKQGKQGIKIFDIVLVLNAGPTIIWPVLMNNTLMDQRCVNGWNESLSTFTVYSFSSNIH